jgi:hypothetical protein
VATSPTRASSRTGLRGLFDDLAGLHLGGRAASITGLRHRDLLGEATGEECPKGRFRATRHRAPPDDDSRSRSAVPADGAQAAGPW